MREPLARFWAFTRRTVIHADRHRIPFLASALTFDALLAAIPFFLLVLVGLSYLARLSPYTSVDDIQQFFARLIPRHADLPPNGPFDTVSHLLQGLVQNRGTVSLYAIPLFIWFATRLFASIRTSLTLVYDVPPGPGPQNILLGFVRGKSRDIMMVGITVTLTLVSAVLATGLSVAKLRGEEFILLYPGFRFFVTGLGKVVTEVFTFASGVVLFYLVFRHASPRRLPRRAAVVGSLFTAVLFEFAKRGYGWYLRNVASVNPLAADANFGAAILFVLWVYYTALVFLIGAVVADTWDLRTRQRLAEVAADQPVAR